MSNPDDARPKTVLALLFYHMNGMDEGFKGLRELHERVGGDIRIRICPAQSILDHIDVTELACKVGIDDLISLEYAEKLKDKVDYFYIPILPFSTVSDVLSFNDREKSIRLLLWALMNGKKVCAYSAGADPFHSIWKVAGMDNGTPFLKHELKRQLERLGAFGIQLFKNNAQLLTYFKPASLRKEKQIITAEVIKKYAKSGKRLLEVEQGTIITPLAWDVAQEYLVEIYTKSAKRPVIGDKHKTNFNEGVPQPPQQSS